LGNQWETKRKSFKAWLFGSTQLAVTEPTTTMSAKEDWWSLTYKS